MDDGFEHMFQAPSIDDGCGQALRVLEGGAAGPEALTLRLRLFCT